MCRIFRPPSDATTAYRPAPIGLESGHQETPVVTQLCTSPSHEATQGIFLLIYWCACSGFFWYRVIHNYRYKSFSLYTWRQFFLIRCLVDSYWVWQRKHQFMSGLSLRSSISQIWIRDHVTKLLLHVCLKSCEDDSVAPWHSHEGSIGSWGERGNLAALLCKRYFGKSVALLTNFIME